MKTTSYKISKKLVEIGFKAETRGHFSEPSSPYEEFKLQKQIPCYDLETILDALPKEIKLEDGYAGLCIIALTGNVFRICYYQPDSFWENEYKRLYTQDQESNESLADTAARLLILLHEKGLVSFNNQK